MSGFSGLVDARSTQTDRKVFTVVGGTACVGPSAARPTRRAAGKHWLRPPSGHLAVTRHISSPFDALPGPFRFAAQPLTVGSLLPDGITELMRDPTLDRRAHCR